MEETHRIEYRNPRTTSSGGPPTVLLIRTAPQRNVPAIRIYTANDTLAKEEYFALFLSFVALEKNYRHSPKNICTSNKVPGFGYDLTMKDTVWHMLCPNPDFIIPPAQLPFLSAQFEGDIQDVPFIKPQNWYLDIIKASHRITYWNCDQKDRDSPGVDSYHEEQDNFVAKKDDKESSEELPAHIDINALAESKAETFAKVASEAGEIFEHLKEEKLDKLFQIFGPILEEEQWQNPEETPSLNYCYNHGNSQQTGCSSSWPENNAGRKGRYGRSGKEKRNRECDPPGSPSGSGNGNPHKRPKRDPESNKEVPCRVRCPYFLNDPMDPNLHPKCLQPILIGRLKEHIHRYHLMTIQCPRCGRRFGDNGQLNTHSQAVTSCARVLPTSSNWTPIPPLVRAQGDALRGMSRTDYEAIFMLLFPDQPVPSASSYMYDQVEEQQMTSSTYAPFHSATSSEERLPRMAVSYSGRQLAISPLRQLERAVTQRIHAEVRQGVEQDMERIRENFIRDAQELVARLRREMEDSQRRHMAVTFSQYAEAMNSVYGEENMQTISEGARLFNDDALQAGTIATLRNVLLQSESTTVHPSFSSTAEEQGQVETLPELTPGDASSPDDAGLEALDVAETPSSDDLFGLNDANYPTESLFQLYSPPEAQSIQTDTVNQSTVQPQIILTEAEPDEHPSANGTDNTLPEFSVPEFQGMENSGNSLSLPYLDVDQMAIDFGIWEHGFGIATESSNSSSDVPPFSHASSQNTDANLEVQNNDRQPNHLQPAAPFLHVTVADAQASQALPEDIPPSLGTESGSNSNTLQVPSTTPVLQNEGPARSTSRPRSASSSITGEDRHRGMLSPLSRTRMRSVSPNDQNPKARRRSPFSKEPPSPLRQTGENTRPSPNPEIAVTQEDPTALQLEDGQLYPLIVDPEDGDANSLWTKYLRGRAMPQDEGYGDPEGGI